MSKFLPDDISAIEEFLRERAQGHAHDPDIAIYGKPAAWTAIADLITRLRAERDEWRQCCKVEAGLRREFMTAASDMRERCAKVAEERALKLRSKAKQHRTPTTACNFAQAVELRNIAGTIRALSVIATELGCKKAPEADIWPCGCHSPNSCQRNRRCMYVGCRHDGGDITALAAIALPSKDVGGGK